MKKLETVAKKKCVSYLLQEIYVFCISYINYLITLLDKKN